MTQVVKMSLDDGGTVLVEVPDEPGSLENAGRTAEMISNASDTLHKAIDRVRPAAAAIRDSMLGMPDPPDRIAVEFGVKVTVDAGVVVAKATSEANFTVHLEWISSSLAARFGND
ncbi:hypothetical protein GCM10010168_25520 [Actinoplanes ianthinogenes]|uniref:Trypsin-co-occurring domain-containing protein n=1 Tax=Actinoplanes ianthinogenes TaxID=122358 RepID=A0ABM7M9B2_9ACTN|nr:CU044_2847 family protein [Actinoplanes ianthinogenes]BCJ48192.1 hypothetical protein Aiant_88490 [Actinoplanes ianthinogenes]GGR07065.1 hypothetical protein GCM10010168_25520 [Actinoplanes ianthinogenes]